VRSVAGVSGVGGALPLEGSSGTTTSPWMIAVAAVSTEKKMAPPRAISSERSPLPRNNARTPFRRTCNTMQQRVESGFNTLLTIQQGVQQGA
jgi:hypothetical protein